MKRTSDNSDLATAKVTSLIRKFALPAIMSSLVGSIYNIADQIFIGQKLGTAGNAATNVAFPLTLLMVTFSMMIGIGGASKFSLYQGGGDNEKAGETIGNSLIALGVSGILLMIITLCFLNPLMNLFGARDEILTLSVAYTGITAIGIPFYIVGSGCSMFIRADGSPKYAMTSTVAGAVMNIILDPILIFKFDMGMRGAALATITGQIVSTVISLLYIRKFRSVKLCKRHFRLNMGLIGSICLLGLPSGLNQLAVITVQILLNNTLGHYGELSVYGREIPLAVVGIVSKVSAVFNSVVFGIAQSCQPIFGYNFGAGNFERVKSAFKQAVVIVTCVSTVAFMLFQLFPHQILEIFQKGNDLYLEFGTSYLRIYMFFIILLGSTILTAIFFPAIGEAKKGIISSLCRQIFQIPLIIVMPLIFGLDGVLYAGPVADLATFFVCAVLVLSEMKHISK